MDQKDVELIPQKEFNFEVFFKSINYRRFTKILPKE